MRFFPQKRYQRDQKPPSDNQMGRLYYRTWRRLPAIRTPVSRTHRDDRWVFKPYLEELLLFGFWYRTRCRRHQKEDSFHEPGEADQPVGPSRPVANRLLGSLPLVGGHRHRPR